jgi:hypothetical protein
MAVLSVVFLLQGIMLSTGFMLPCFLMVLCYFWFGSASKREYEYTLDDESLKIERTSDRGRRILHEIPWTTVKLLCRPDAPEALPYKKGGSIPIRKVDYTSYKEDASDGGNSAVYCPGGKRRNHTGFRGKAGSGVI